MKKLFGSFRAQHRALPSPSRSRRRRVSGTQHAAGACGGRLGCACARTRPDSLVRDARIRFSSLFAPSRVLLALGSVLCCESGASRYAARALAAYRSLVFARPLIRATRALSPWGPAGTGTGTGTASAERELPDTTPSSEPQLFHTMSRSLCVVSRFVAVTVHGARWADADERRRGALAWRLAALLGGAGEAARLAGAARALARAAPGLPAALRRRRPLPPRHLLRCELRNNSRSRGGGAIGMCCDARMHISEDQISIFFSARPERHRATSLAPPPAAQAFSLRRAISAINMN
ncbi:hypothetical protein MSG28_014357 [Choristoneura fumiferana]|uniref:Uncharacterized protein n=1 Tax=Choristoneura fumiferana TaxID=7141 RepID=A0ACC0JH24_CHOFU|nr:hypothetical protein MSG28_014357 [Choristoneura fumiferana]